MPKKAHGLGRGLDALIPTDTPDETAASVQEIAIGQIDPNEIDYTKPEAQRKLLNHLINTGEDGKEKLDALKTIVSMQKDDREAAKDNKVQRFYMPLKCTQCPLHARAEKRRERVAREKAALEAAKKAAEEAGVEFVEPDKDELLNEDDESFLDADHRRGEVLPAQLQTAKFLLLQLCQCD